MPSRTLPVPRAIEAQGARIKELEENQRDLLKIVRLNEDFLLALDRNHEGLTKQVEKMVSYQEWLGQNLLKLEAVVDEHIGTALSRMCAGASDTKPATPPEETSGGDETPRAKTTSSGEQAQLDDSSARRNTEMTELVRILEVFKRTESGIEGVREEVAALAADLNTLSKEDDEETKSLPDERFDYEKGLADIANSLRAAPVVQSGSATKEPGRMRVTREYHDRYVVFLLMTMEMNCAILSTS